MTSGTEWIVDAHGCRAEALRSVTALEALFARIIDELRLRPVSAPIWHQFPGEGGITGMVLLSESHLSVHTFPESEFAAFNLYCCAPRQGWDWEAGLADSLSAQVVRVRVYERGSATSTPATDRLAASPSDGTATPLSRPTALTHTPRR
jgi:S-adenosylmethionine decarboxylase